MRIDVDFKYYTLLGDSNYYRNLLVSCHGNGCFIVGMEIVCKFILLK